MPVALLALVKIRRRRDFCMRLNEFEPLVISSQLTASRAALSIYVGMLQKCKRTVTYLICVIFTLDHFVFLFVTDTLYYVIDTLNYVMQTS